MLLGDSIAAIYKTLEMVMKPVNNYRSSIGTIFFGRSFEVKLLYFIIISACLQIDFRLQITSDLPSAFI